MSKIEEDLAKQIALLKLPAPVREYRFSAHHVGLGPGIKKRLSAAKLKDWRFDFAWPELMLAVEVEGITSYGRNKNGSMRLGRHQTAKGMEEDCLKYGEAMKLGWNLYRCTGGMVKQGIAINTVEYLIGMLLEDEERDLKWRVEP